MRTRNLFFLLCFLICGSLWAAENPDFEPKFTFQETFNTDTVPATYSADQVFIMGLLYSECPQGSESWNRCIKSFETIKADVTSPEMQALSQEERGRAILKYLYRDYLSKYSLNQTRLDVALEEGTYNCVSSAVLYMAAAKAGGLQVYGQRTSQHAFCTIYVPSKKANQLTKIDVETTNPYGFNPGSKETIENESQIKKYYVVPKKYYSNRQQVSDGVFAGLIAGNLCSDYIKKNDYFTALPLGAARFDAVRNENPSKGTSLVRSEFDILACNYINLMPEGSQKAEKYASMLEWFTRFIDRWESNDFVQKNMDSTFNNLFVLCINEKNFPLAEEYYEKLKPYVSKKQLEKSNETLADIYVLSKTDGQTASEQIQTIKELKASRSFSLAQERRIDLYLENAWLDILNPMMTAGRFVDGYLVSLDALEDLPLSSGIKKMNQSFYNNCIAEIHNDFALAANNQNFDEAIAILENGLERFPGDKTLTKDLADLKKFIGQ